LLLSSFLFPFSFFRSLIFYFLSPLRFSPSFLLLFYFLIVRWELVHLTLRPLLAYCTSPGYDRWWWLWGSQLNENWQGKPKYSEKTCLSATFSTTNPHDLTWARTQFAAMARRPLFITSFSIFISLFPLHPDVNTHLYHALSFTSQAGILITL
jgi:hypothetical protein